ncbi:MAG: hypothetical protein KGK33_07250 [Hyphomicrobiales bacterium]|nr:hypothetical protein [Hyphomicrobiales bacterium]MDE2284393.1 hypothetical protein [Hyphomicrobiales bacterium]
MWMPRRFIMAAFALFFVWTLVRAWRTGWIYDGMWTFNADDNPVMYSLEFGVRVFLVAMFVAGAIGYTPAQFFAMVGLGSIVPYLPHGRV